MTGVKSEPKPNSVTTAKGLNGNQLRELFQEFHQNPELSGQEYRTTERIRDILIAAGIEILPTNLKTGIIGIIWGRGDFTSESKSIKNGRPAVRTIALRADIDALPIQETSGVSFASRNVGVQHACGHDFHLTALLGAATRLSSQIPLDVNVLLIFQPAEETASGAKQVVAELEKLDLDIEAFYGAHVNADIPVGTIGLKSGVMSAAVDRFQITATGRGAHGAAPHLGNDINVAIAELVLSLQTIVSRKVDPFSPTVVSVTRISSGTTWNVLPSEGQIEGTVRSFSPQERGKIKEYLEAAVKGVGEIHGVALNLDWQPGPPSVLNEPSLVEHVDLAAKKLNLPVIVPNLRAGGEDFAEYQAVAPGAFFLVGVGPNAPSHTSNFVADADALEAATNLFLQVVAGYIS